MRRITTALLVLTLVSAARAEDDLDRMVRPFIESGYAPGIVIATVDSRGTTVRGWGKARDGDVAPPDGTTVFEIGSVTKTFTGLLLADAVERKEVKLDDPVRALLPPGVAPALAKGDVDITLLDLATHTSGLPRIPDNMDRNDLVDPYGKYGTKELEAWLAKHPLEKDEEAGFAYSNLGMGLLGHALAAKAGKSYEALLRERVLEPLGMKDTTVALTDPVRARLAQGHTADGDATGPWSFDALAGCGGIRSTANDMVLYLRANLGLAETPLARAIALAHAPRTKIGGGMSIGLAWHVLPGGILFHNGQTGGFHSIALFDPARKAGAVVLANSACMQLDAMGIGARVRGVKNSEPVKLRGDVAVDEAALAKHAGVYRMAGGPRVTISRDGARLFIQIEGQPRFRLHASSPETFHLRAIEAEVTFEKDAFVIHQNGQDHRAKRAE